MEIWHFVIVLFCIILGVQFFIDVTFAFLLFITGVATLKIVTLLNTQHQFLSYRSFKRLHKLKKLNKQPYQVGCVVWLCVFLVVFIIN